MQENKLKLTQEYLKNRFIDKKWSYYKIYKESGWSKSAINIAIGKFGLRKRRNLRKLNLVGQKFGGITVLSSAPKKLKANYWNCICECGTKLQASTGNLLAENYVSCGCNKNKKGNLSSSWRGKGKLSSRYWHILEHNSQKRGIYFNLSIDEAWELFEKQGEKCALTNWIITLATDSSQTASLDRIDSSKGYTINNVQWVHKNVNKAKNVFSQSYFLKMCLDIAKAQNKV